MIKESLSNTQSNSLDSSASLPNREGFFSRIKNKFATYAAISSLGLGGGLAPKADGAVYTTGTTDQQTLDFGAQFAGDVLNIRINSPVYGPPGYRSASCAFLNKKYALTCTHVIQDTGAWPNNITSIEVSDGPNYKTNRGNVVAISNIIFHPTLDLAILEFATPFQFSENKTIGTANVDDIVVYAGYGSWGTGSSTSLVWSGDRRAWDARVYNSVIGGSAPFYQSTTFGFANTSGLSLNARGANGDSGCPVFNLAGELIGLGKSSSSNIADSGTTTHVVLGEPSVKAWILANTQVPEEPQLPPNTDLNGNRFTELQEYHLKDIPKNFHVGDSVNIDLAPILSLLPLPSGQSYAITGLPKGLSFNPTTGVISGTILAELGNTAVKILIKDGTKNPKSVVFDLKVDPYKFLGCYEVLIENGSLPIGKAKLIVTSPKVFTASLELQGQAKRSAKGTFTNPANGDEQTISVTFPAGKGGVPAATTLDFTVSYGSDLVFGSNGINTLRGFRLLKSGTAPKQLITVALDPDVPGDRVNTPGGNGYARGSASSNGLVALSGMLGDAQAFTASLGLSKTNQAVVFMQPYKDKTASFFGGVITIGNLGIPERQATSESISEGILWRKIANSLDKSYPLGIGVSVPLSVTGKAGKWMPVTTAEILSDSLGLNYREILAGYNAPTSGNYPALLWIQNNFSLSTLAPAMPVLQTLKFNRSTGAITGNLTLPAPATKSSASGVILQDESFRSRVGTGLIKVPTTTAVKGSFDTVGLTLDNGQPSQ